MQSWKTQESAVLSSFEIKKEKLDKDIKTFRKLAFEWKEAKTKEAKQSAKIPIKQKRKSSDSNKKSPKVKKANPAQPPTQPPAQPPAAFSSDDSDSGSSNSYVEA